jgi:hypothetical protein
VHRVERNQGVHITEGKARLTDLTTRTIINYPEVTIKPGDIPGFGSAWVAYAYWANTSGQPITSFRTTWQVPEPPSTDSNQIIYLFSGIDPSDPSTGILQPVLQWGRSEAGGGPYWSVASWYVAGASAGSNAYYTTPVQVNPGDTLVGAMTLTNQSGGTFDYNCEFEGISGTSLPALNHPELVWCNETLEVYNVAQCSDYPASSYTAMRAINIQTGAMAPVVNWVAENQPTDCGQYAVVTTNSGADGAVDIHYRAPQVPLPVDQLTSQLRIMFGVTNTGDGTAILPSGHTVRVPAADPSGPLFQQIASEIGEVARGFAIREAVKDSSSQQLRNTIEVASLELMAKALDNASRTIKKALPRGRSRK